MVDQTLKVGIDARGAKKGSTEYAAAITKITKSLKQLNKSAASDGTKFRKISNDLNKLSASMKSMRGPSKSTITNFNQLIKTLRDAKIKGSFAAQLTKLGTAMQGFKAPPASASKNFRTLINALKEAKIKGGLAAQLTKLGMAMKNFKAPPAAAAKNFSRLLKTLATAKINGRVAGQLAKISLAMKGFKAPSATQTRNLHNFFKALTKMQGLPSFTKIANGLKRIGNAAAKATVQLSAFATALGRVKGKSFASGVAATTAGMGRFGSSMGRATGQTKAFSGSLAGAHTIGLQFAALFGGMSMAGFVTGMFNATIQAQRFKTTIGITAKSLTEQNAVVEHARGVANAFGLDLRTVYEEFGKFSTASRLAGETQETTNFVFEQFAGAMRVMGLGADRQKLVFLALTQMFSKGTISSEELKRQLGEQIPGAFELMQQSLRKLANDPNLDLSKLLKSGAITSKGVVLLAGTIGKVFGPKFLQAMSRADTQMGRLKNSWTDFLVAVGDGDGKAMQAIRDVAFSLTSVLQGDGDFKSLADTIGKGLATAIRAAGDAAMFLIKHMSTIGTVIKGLISLKLGSIIFGWITAIRGFSLAALTVSGPIGAIALAVAGVVAAITYLWNETLTFGNTSVRVSDLVYQAWDDTKVVFSALGQVAGQAATDISEYFFGSSKDGQQAFKDLFNFMISGITSTVDIFQTHLFAIPRTVGAVLGSVKRFMSGGGFASKEEMATTIMGGSDLWERVGERRGKDYFGGLEKAATSFAERAKAAAAQREKERAAAQKAATEKRNAQDLATMKKFNDSAKKQGDLNIDDVIRGGKAGLSGSKATKDAVKAAKLYKDAVKELDSQLKSGIITNNQYAESLRFNKQVLEESVDPYQSLLRSMREEIELKQMSGKAGEKERDFRDKTNALLAKGIALTGKQKEELRGLIDIQSKLANPTGVQGFIAGLDDMETALGKIEENAIKGLADEITNLVVDGKADFRSLAKSILKQFVKLAINNMFKSLFGGGSKTVKVEHTGFQHLDKKINKIMAPTSSELKAREKQLTGPGMNGSSALTGSGGKAIDPARFDNTATQSTPALDEWKATVENKLKTDAENTPLDFGSTLRGTLQPKIQKLGEETGAKLSEGVNKIDVAQPVQTSMENGAVAAINRAFASVDISGATNAAMQNGVQGKLPAGMRGTIDPNRSSFNPARFNNTANTQSFGSSKTLGSAIKNGKLHLSERTLKDLAKANMTETPSYLKGKAYSQLSRGNLDVMTNRMASKKFPDSARGVLDQNNQFSAINSRYGPNPDRTSVTQIPDSVLDSRSGKRMMAETRAWAADRASGGQSSVGGALNYANDREKFSGRNSSARGGWIRDLKGPEFGSGESTHKYGTAGGGAGVGRFGISTAGSAGAGADTSGLDTFKQKMEEVNTTSQTTSETIGQATEKEKQAAEQKRMASQQSAASTQQASQSEIQHGDAVMQAGQKAGQASPQFDQAGNSIQQAGQQAASAGQQASTATPGMSGLGGGIQSLIGTMSSGTPQIGQFASAILQMISSMAGGGGGGGGGAAMGLFSTLLGAMSEGGISTSPVGSAKASMSSFAGAPSYSEGTTNTGTNGMDGIPSVLHPNEAVIPLTRGRKIPIDTGDKGMMAKERQGSGSNMTLNINGVTDMDGFKRSEKQIMAKLQAQAARISSSNN